MRAIILFVSVGLSFGVNAQYSKSPQWSANVGLGFNKTINPHAPGYYSNTINITNIQVGAMCLIRPAFGFGVKLDYNQFKHDDLGVEKGSNFFKTNYLSTNVFAVANLGEILEFSEFSSRLGLLLNTGVGVSSMFNDSLRMGIKTGSDEMLNFTVGLIPQFRLTKRITLQSELAIVSHVYQNRTFDMTSLVFDRGVDGYLITANVGVSIALNPNDNEFGVSEKQWLGAQLESTQSRYDSIVKSMQDDDADGVPNYLDREPDTLAGEKVNAHGETVQIETVIYERDTMVDFVYSEVEFPEKLGLFYTIQVGYLSNVDPNTYKTKYGIDVVVKPQENNDFRVLTGYFDSALIAEQSRDALYEGGLTGAFIAAYYKGKRITIAEADRLLSLYGKIILENKNR